ncbi:MAG: leucine-rich repeat domain-containing protein [Bacteroidaceae bacterium]|nr:leucine-rich repeat domain-containing protein [Bacteroidaceae bacterium]
MKRLLFLLLVTSLPIMANAYDAQINGIYYNFSGNEASVTYQKIENLTFISDYSGDITIPETVTYNGITYSVTSINNYALYNCCNLTSIAIPESVTRIGVAAFSGCGLTSICIPKSVISIDRHAFWDCSNLMSIIVNNENPNYDSRSNCNALIETKTNTLLSGCMNTIIPNSITCIDDCAFRNCTGLISINIPDNVTSIGHEAFSGCYSLTTAIIGSGVEDIKSLTFYNCSNLTSVTIPMGVTSINTSAFAGCSSLTSVTLESDVIVSESRTSRTSIKTIFGEQVKEYVIGNDITCIGNYAFFGCNALTSITIGNNVTSIGNDAFIGCDDVKFYVNRGTDGLLTLWNYGTTPYEIGTTQRLARPSISAISTTQTSIRYQINNMYSDLEYTCTYDEAIDDNEFLLTGLRPAYTQNIPLTVSSANNTFRTSANITTSPISPTVISNDVTASSISVEGTYIVGDAKVISCSLTIGGDEMAWEAGKLHGLKPNTTYNCRYTVVVEYGDGNTYPYEGSSGIRTAPLTLTTQQPKVITVGNVVVAANSNLDDEETNVGFEWRRIDWTDDFASNTGSAYLYNGTMEGYIRNLYIERLWKYRPFYESDSGNRYYGEWVGIDPTNTSYFEPTVHTYATITVTGNKAEVKGYAMRGTDNVTSQGFMYWPVTVSSPRRKVNGIPSGATIVLASGNVMTATLEDLEYETEYCYAAFVTTSEGETFLGETQTFRTSFDPDGIKDIENESLTPALSKGEGVWYSLDGKKLDKPQKGINIIRYSDGISKKVLVK